MKRLSRFAHRIRRAIARTRPKIRQDQDKTEPNSLTRAQKILYCIDKNTPGVEIGPSYSPVAPKAAGYHVHVIDHASRAELVAKYSVHKVPVQNIEEVDFVWKGESYAELTGNPHFYNWIIASHMIEHVPNFIGFLDNCASILKCKMQIAKC